MELSVAISPCNSCSALHLRLHFVFLVRCVGFSTCVLVFFFSAVLACICSAVADHLAVRELPVAVAKSLLAQLLFSLRYSFHFYVSGVIRSFANCRTQKIANRGCLMGRDQEDGRGEVGGRSA